MNLQFKDVLVINKPLRLTWLGAPLAILWLLSITPVNAAQNDNMLSLSEAVQQTLTQHPSLQVFPIRQQQLAAQKQQIFNQVVKPVSRSKMWPVLVN